MLLVNLGDKNKTVLAYKWY